MRTQAANQKTDIKAGPPVEKFPDASGDENAEPTKTCLSPLPPPGPTLLLATSSTSPPEGEENALVTALVTASAKSAAVMLMLPAADEAADCCRGSALHRSTKKSGKKYFNNCRVSIL